MTRRGDRIQGHRAHGGVLLVPCLLDDTYRQWFLVDTGAAITILSSEVAEEIELDVSEPLRRQRVASVHQVVSAPVVQLRNLQVGSQSVTDLGPRAQSPERCKSGWPYLAQ